MKRKRMSALVLIPILVVTMLCMPVVVNPEERGAYGSLQNDQPVSLRFFGSASADLFTRELEESFRGVLEKNFVGVAGNGVPAGFVNASLPGFPWAGTMWTRDGGTFMRELVMHGYYEHAALLAECLTKLVQKNQQGYYVFPMYFKGSPQYFKGEEPGSATEVDGSASIAIGMALLWERLPEGHPAKKRIQEFMFQDASPLNYFRFLLATRPLVPGTGEFGCGMGVKEPDMCYNVVQNNLVRLAFLATANMAEESGNAALAQEYRRLAAKCEDGMAKYLVDKDGSWIWSIDPATMKPDVTNNDSKENSGFGGLNGVASMNADVLGFQPLVSSSKSAQHSDEATFQRLYRTPLRRQEFDRYGIWTQFDLLAGGLLSSPAYGQGYALQTMLLYDKLEMADKAISWLANAIYNPVPEYKLHRSSPYYFYERTYSPDAVGKIELEEGCGALNLVNVTEPLKVSRLLLGVDDTAPQSVVIIPRIPASWKGVEARNWPIRSRHGIVRAHIVFERKGAGAELTLTLGPGQRIDDLRVRMPSTKGYVWREWKDTGAVSFVTQ
jgi:hypothetical protein